MQKLSICLSLGFLPKQSFQKYSKNLHSKNIENLLPFCNSTKDANTSMQALYS